jgi:hypothetical protein
MHSTAAKLEFTSLQLRTFALAVALAIASPAAAEPVKLEPGKPVTLTCQTQSIVVKDNGPAPTKGAVTLRLELKDPATAQNATGTWTPVSADANHTGAFVSAQKTACASGCPLSVPANGEPQLWAPAPKSIDKLGADEVLLLAVIKPDTLSLKASTFRGPSIEALESGTCVVVP